MKRVASLSAALLLACSSEPVTLGLTEPVRVNDAQFQEGGLPGLPPQTLEEILAEVPPVQPAFTAFSLNVTPIELAEERTASGLTTTDAVAVGVRFESLGSGYWVPDYRLEHRLTGKVVLLEVLGFWRKSSAVKHLQYLKRYATQPFLLAVSDQLHIEEGLDDLPAGIHRFRHMPLADEVARLASEVAGV